MTTTEQLRDALTADAEAAATPEHLAAVRRRLALTGDDLTVVEAPSRRPRRLRLALSAGVVAVVAATVVTLFVALRPGATTTPAADPSALTMDTWDFTVGADPGGLQFRDGVVTPGTQGGFWYRFAAGDAPIPFAALTVLDGRGEQPLPTRPADAVTVSVAGTTGWSAPVAEPGIPAGDRGGTSFYADRTTVWRDASGLTVDMRSSLLDTDRITQLAATVRVGEQRPVTGAVRFDWLPPGLTLTNAGPGYPGYYDLSFDTADGSILIMQVNPLAYTNGGAVIQGTAPPQTIRSGPYTGTYVADNGQVFVTDGRVGVSVDWYPSSVRGTARSQSLPLDQLTRLLAGLTVADPEQPSTWYDLATAIPS